MSEQATRPWTKPVVVGVDGSESSVDALRHARRFAEALQLPVVVLTAWTWPPFVEGAGYMNQWSPEEDARTIAEGAVEQVFGESSDVTIRIAQGAPAKLLIEASSDASMLVVGSRGHGGFAGLLLGSVSSTCAEHAHCPVLVVHDDE